MKCILGFLCIGFLLLTTGFAKTSDTIVVQSNGYGLTQTDATNDALRKATEQSLGLILSSTTMIQNYMTVKDVINTSSNAYVYKYETISTEYDQNANLFSVIIKAFITKDLLLNAVNAKMATDTTIDMTEIEKLKFEMAQAKMRAKSAVAYYASFIQNNFRKYVKIKFDSLSVIDKDVVSMKAKIRMNYSIGLTEDSYNFLSKAIELNQRAFEYSKRRYSSSYEVHFKIRLNNESHYFGNDDGTHYYKFVIQLHSLPKDTIKSACKSGYYTVKFFKNDSINKAMFTYDISKKPCELVNDTVRFPFISFLPTHKSGPAFSFPFESLRQVKPNQYSNSYLIEMPIDSIKPDFISITYSVDIGEYVIDSKGQMAIARTYPIVKSNNDNDIVSLFKDY